jgi:hypothetical protein
MPIDHVEIAPGVTDGIRALRVVFNTPPEALHSFPALKQSCSEWFRVKADDISAIGTSDLIITLEPTERLVELVTAVRTREAKGCIGEESREVGQIRESVYSQF